MRVTTEPTIVGMPYSEFAKKYGEDKAKEALQRIYGTTDPQKAAEIQQQRTQQILNQQSQQKPTQATSPGPTSPSALVQTRPGQLAPGYSITTGQPVTQPTQLKTPDVVEPLVYKPQVDIKSAPVEKPASPPQTGSVVYKTVEHEPLQKVQIGEVIYDVTPQKVVETTVVQGKVVDIKKHKAPEGMKFDVEKVKEEVGGKIALKTQNLTTIRKPIEVEIPVGAKIENVTYEPKTDEISYIVSREATTQTQVPKTMFQQPVSQLSHPYSTLENPYIKVALEKGLTKEQQFREKVEQAKKEYLEMGQQTPYSKLQEEVSKEIGQMQPGATRFLKMQAAFPALLGHQLLHGITEPIRQAQIIMKYGEAGKAAIREVQAQEKEMIEQQKQQLQAEFAYYQANPKKVWEDIAKMSPGEKVETALKLGAIVFSARSLAKGPAPGVKETYRVKVEPSESKVIAETTKGESMATTKGKIVVEKVTTYGEGKEAVKTVGEYDLKVVSQGVKQGKDVVGTHVIKLVDKKTGAVEEYQAIGKAREISSAVQKILEHKAEGKEISVYQGKQLFVTKQTMYKTQAELVMQPSTLERPYPEIGIRYTVEKTQSKALGSYEFLRRLERPGVEHPYKPYEVLGQEVGRVGAISKQKIARVNVEFAQKGTVEAALIRGKPIEEPKGFYPLPKEKPIVDENVAAGMRFLFGEQKVQAPVKPTPTAELSVMQQALIKDIAAMKAPAPATTKTIAPIIPIYTQQERPEKVGVNIESASQAFFSKIGTFYVKETLLNEEEQKARVVTVGPKVTEEQVQAYLTKQVELEKTAKETATKFSQEVLTTIEFKEGVEERTKKVVGMKSEQRINLEGKKVQKLVEKQIQRQMMKRKVIQPTIPTKVFPPTIPLKVVSHFPKPKGLGGEKRERKNKTSQAIEAWLLGRPIAHPKDVLKALKKVKFI